MSFCDAENGPSFEIPEPHCAELRARQSVEEYPVDPEPLLPSLRLEEEDFQCSICLCLLHKPCVNSCGHVFCFWCIHLAMNGLGNSRCPVCRAPYTRLPSICLPLHHFVSRQFPEEARRRALDVADEEAAVGVQSPALPPSGRRALKEEEFSCGLCGRLAYEPTVPSCGHVFCRACVAAPLAAGPIACPAPQCHLNLHAVPTVCLAMHTLLAAAFEAPYFARRAESEAGLEREPSLLVESPGLPVVQPPFSPIEEMEAECQDPGFVHYSIICDGCGVYPIVGHRWRCRDCSEKIGFDICGDCYKRQVHRQARTGKFNQCHLPTHRMLLVEQVQDVLHRLTALHPELSVDQLIALVKLALATSEDAAAPLDTSGPAPEP